MGRLKRVRGKVIDKGVSATGRIIAKDGAHLVRQKIGW
jgi:hypothetical protein